ncbi:undecaprenyl diphosphate synthase family protein, partial [Treponema pallidum]
MDGNGRWAERRGLRRSAGHRRGLQTAREIVAALCAIRVPFVTLYVFSTENWKRSA